MQPLPAVVQAPRASAPSSSTSFDEIRRREAAVRAARVVAEAEAAAATAAAAEAEALLAVADEQEVRVAGTMGAATL